MSDAPLVRKLYALGAALHDPVLHAPEKRVMYWLCDYANSQFEAWPSTRTLARVSGIGHRNLSRHLRALVEQGYIVQVSAGSRSGASARYRLTLKGELRMRERKKHGGHEVEDGRLENGTSVVSRDDTSGAVTSDDTVSFSLTRAVVATDANVSFPMTTEPPTEPAQKAGEVGGSGFGTGPGGPALAAERERLFQQFKSAYPKPLGTKDARAEFFRLLDEGLPAARLVDQAEALRQYVDAGGMNVQYVKQGARWLRERDWEEDTYVVSTKRASASKKSSSTGAPKELPTETSVEVPVYKAPLPVDADAHSESRKRAKNRRERLFAPQFFSEVRARLDAVRPELPLTVKLRDAYLAALQRGSVLEDECLWLGQNEVREQVNTAVGEALHNDWGDEEGMDERGKQKTSVYWFGSEEGAPLMLELLDTYVARCLAASAHE